MRVETKLNGSLSISLTPERPLEATLVQVMRDAIESGQHLKVQTTEDGGIRVVLEDIG